MTTLDPATGRPLPADAIQRVLYICNKVHVYQIPPLTSTKGFTAGGWTSPTQPTAREIFQARVRIMETSLAKSIKADIVLEDPKTGDLFAAAPYTAPAAVQPALDSSRFFAIRVVGEGGMKATLGIGFEERSDAFDFSIALGDQRKVLGFDGEQAAQSSARGPSKAKPVVEEPKRDFSLKEGQTIHVELGGKGRRSRNMESTPTSAGAESAALFSIKPPPAVGSSGGMPILAPPPSASDVKAGTSPSPSKAQAQDLGFDDGEFGEFQ